MATLERIHRGRTANCAGRAAEEQVAARYAGLGAELLEARWRGRAGEIDLIFEHLGVVVFVEVKSSSDHRKAVASLSVRQQLSIMAAAEEYLGRRPDGLLTEMRVDVALVAHGRIEIIEGALGL